MDTAIIASLISAAAAIVVCMVNNHFTMKRTEKAQQDNIVLISYRLEQLEQKVDRHNNLIARTYELERRADVLEEKQRVANHRIDDLEKHIDNDGR
jgi:predicted transcriptional regulator